MKVLKSNYKIGNRVLFLWEQHPYTGIINSIGETTYGISPDANYYETDRMMIPRLCEEVFIPKSLCIHTGEMFIDHKDDSPLRTRYQYRFGDDVKRAYEMLPKRSIYPGLIKGLEESFIEFIPGKMLFKTKDNRIYFYCSRYSVLPSLITRDGIIAKPKWIYQLPEKSGDCGYGIVSEEDIEIIWEINDHIEGVDPWDAFAYGRTDIIYNTNSTKLRLTNESFGLDTGRINIDVDKIPKDFVKYPKF